MFNDALDDYYVRAIAPLGNDWFHLSDITVRGTSGLNYNMNRQDIFTARYFEAFAQVSSDTAYIVVLRYEGDETHNQGGRPGAFQNPLPPDPRNVNPNQNLWGLNELPTLQRQVSVYLPLFIQSSF